MENDEDDISTDNEIKGFIYAGRVTVPEFEIFTTPLVNISEIKRRRFNIIDKRLDIKQRVYRCY